MIYFDIITIFPEIVKPYFQDSLIKKAQDNHLIRIKIHNLRDFVDNKHKTIDDKPYGGGPGMVMMVEPIYKAVSKIRTENKAKVILLSAKGQKFNQDKAQQWQKMDQLIFICGRYEGVDERVAEYVADEEISIGDFVLSGGELGAMIIIESMARLVPGVLGNKDCLVEESFSPGIKKEYPQYTRPEKFKEWSVPAMLLSGNHAGIEAWRKQSKNI